MRSFITTVFVLLLSSGIVHSASASETLSVKNRYQSAYQVVVASSKQKLEAGDYDVWNSEKRDSDATNQVVYKGAELRSGSPYFWKVQVWDENGHTIEDTQTSYALALYFNLYPDNLAQKGADRLAEKIKLNGNKFTTGFLGTKNVMLVLAQYGYSDLAYQLFKQTEYPSWGYSVVNGATSIWERWDSYTKNPDQNAELNLKMNSFSHYSFGAVAEWMFMNGLGIDTEGAGFRNIIIKPSVSAEMDFMKGSYQSINGTISSEWELKGDKLNLNVSIPVNTKAKIFIPTSRFSSIQEGKVSIDKIQGIEVLRSDADETVLEVGSGRYAFSCKQ
jgi:alpha-L-rhamnosidase